jgi:hypothetical protein
MRKIFTGLCIVSILGLCEMQAQSKNEIWRSDPTYSVNNYKHPNKAAAVKNIQQSGEVNVLFVHQPIDGHNTPKAMIPARKILVTEKTENGKIKTPLAIRRKASEKLSHFVLGSETDHQQMDE